MKLVKHYPSVEWQCRRPRYYSQRFMANEARKLRRYPVSYRVMRLLKDKDKYYNQHIRVI